MWNGKFILLSMLVLMIAVGVWYYLKRGSKEFPEVTENSTERVQALYTQMREKGIAKTQFILFLRAFKAEQELEVWVGTQDQEAFQHLITYPICKSSGVLGPKRKEGDLQVPEGCYYIDRMNPNSSFHLSLGLNYPNASDKIRGDQQEPGSDIFIHGGCVTVGCLPITDQKIEELYQLVSQARANGQAEVPVHIFPGRFDTAEFRRDYNDSLHAPFWQELLPIYQYFERHKMLPSIRIDVDGAYQI